MPRAVRYCILKRRQEGVWLERKILIDGKFSEGLCFANIPNRRESHNCKRWKEGMYIGQVPALYQTGPERLMGTFSEIQDTGQEPLFHHH